MKKARQKRQGRRQGPQRLRDLLPGPIVSGRQKEPLEAFLARVGNRWYAVTCVLGRERHPFGRLVRDVHNPLTACGDFGMLDPDWIVDETRPIPRRPPSDRSGLEAARDPVAPR